jgi:hypothetical protein
MPRTAGYTDGATPPSYVTRAYAFDTDWKRQAVCRGHNKPGSPFKDAWTTDPSTLHIIGEGPDAKVITGQMLIDVALTFCQMCPVQWDCTTWALDVGERIGTWGVAYDDLEWLRHQRVPQRIVDNARSKGVAVQVYVTARRRRVQPVRV